MHTVALRLALVFAVALAPPALAQSKKKDKGPKLRPVSTLIKELGDSAKAGAAIGELVQHGKQAAGPLARALKDKDETVRKNAANALGQIGAPAVGAAPALLPLAMSGDAAALAALGKLGPKAVPTIARGLKAKDPKVRAQFAALLGSRGEEAKAAVGALSSLLAKDKDPAVRAAAAGALGKMGKSGLKGVSSLSRALKDKDPKVAAASRSALQALAADAPKSVKARIEKLLAAGQPRTEEPKKPKKP